MTIFKTIILTVALLFSPLAQAETLNLNQINEAACRVGVSGALGSGTCIDEQDGKYYVLTNAHVVGKSKTATLDFFKYGRKTHSVAGNVIWSRYMTRTDMDLALITVPVESFGEMKPRVIPLAPREFDVSKYLNGDQAGYVCSAGFPNGQWPGSCWEGQYYSIEQGRLIFKPAPESGRSGSGLFVLVPDTEGKLHTRLAGVVTWRTGEGLKANGGAVSIAKLYQIMNEETNVVYRIIPNHYQEIQNSVPQLPGSRIICNRDGCGLGDDQHAIGSDYKLYCITYFADGRKECYSLPPGVRIVSWPNRGGGDRVPVPGQEEDTGGTLPDIGSPWPGVGDESTELLAKITELEAEITNLKTIISNITVEKNTLTEEKSRLSINITNLTQLNEEYKLVEIELSKLEQQKLAAEKQLQSVQSTYDKMARDNVILNQNRNALAETNDKLNMATVALTDDNLSLHNKNDGLTKANGLLARSKDKLKTVFGWTAGGLGTALLFSIVFIVWNRKKRLVGQAIDMVQDKVDTVIEPVIGDKATDYLRDKVDRLEGVVEKMVDKAVESKTPKIVRRRRNRKPKGEESEDQLSFNPVVEMPKVQPPAQPQVQSSDSPPKTGQQATTGTTTGPWPNINITNTPTYNIVDSNGNIVGQIQDKDTVQDTTDGDTTDENTTDDDTTDDISTGPNPSQTPEPTFDDKFDVDVEIPDGDENTHGYIRAFCQNKQKDGENIKHLAIFGVLYKEAVALLKQGRFYYKGDKGNRLLGQRKTADRIEAWVKEQFLLTMTKDKLGQSNVFHEAYFGFLYKQAIQMLREGRFNVLGYEDTAEAIEGWVRDRFIQQTTGITF